MTRQYRDEIGLFQELGWPLERDSDPEDAPARWPGKRTRTMSLSPGPVFRRAAATDGDYDPRAQALLHRADGGAGEPLRPDLRDRFERSLGADLSAVRVHVGGHSAEAATAIGARAYAVGNDIHFAEGEYRPDDAFGLHLLAHEVAHTAQQAGRAAVAQTKLDVSMPGDAAEVEADHAADAMVAGRAFALSAFASARVHRDPAPADAKKPAPPKLEKGQYAIGRTTNGGKYIWVSREEAAGWSSGSRMIFDIYCRRYFPSATPNQIAEAFNALAPNFSEGAPPSDAPSERWIITPGLVESTTTWMTDHGVSVSDGTGADGGTPEPDEASIPSAVGIPGGTGKPGDVDKVTAERTIAQINELYAYLKKNYPEHPIFKNKNASVRDLVEYLQIQDAYEKSKFDGISLMENHPERLRGFLDKWERGEQLYAPTTDPTEAPEGVPSMQWEGAGRITIEPETGDNTYAVGNWIVFRVAFKTDDQNNLINVQPQRANFSWSVTGGKAVDKKGQAVAAGGKDGTSHGDLPSARSVWTMDFLRSAPNGPGLIDYRVELKEPGAYSVGVSVGCPNFIGGYFKPQNRNIIVRAKQDRVEEVFADNLEASPASQFEKDEDGEWKARDTARAMTLADRVAAAKSKRELLVAAKEQGKADDAAIDAAIEKLDEEIEKLEELDGDRVEEAKALGGGEGTEQPYVVSGAFFDEVRGTSGPLQLTAYAIRSEGEKDGKKTETLAVVLIDSTMGKHEKHAAIIKDETPGEQLERDAIAEVVAHFRSTNRLPDGTAKILFKLHSTGAPCQMTTSTANTVKTVKEQGANIVKWGTVVVCTMTIVGVEVPLVIGGAMALAGAAGPAGDMAQRARTGTFGDDVGQEAIDILDLATQVAPLGASALKAPSGWMAVSLKAADAGQQVVLGARTYKEIEEIKAKYGDAMAAPGAKKAELEKQMNDEIAGALSNAIQTGTLMIVMSGAGAHKSGPRATPNESAKWKGKINAQIQEFATKATEAEVQSKLNTDKRLTRFEREYLEDWLRFHEHTRNAPRPDGETKPDGDPKPDGDATPDGAATPDATKPEPAKPDPAKPDPAAAPKPGAWGATSAVAAQEDDDEVLSDVAAGVDEDLSIDLTRKPAAPAPPPEPAPPTGGDFARELRRKMSAMAERLFRGADLPAAPVAIGPGHDHHTEIDLRGLVDDPQIAGGAGPEPYDLVGGGATFVGVEDLVTNAQPTETRGTAEAGDIQRGVSDAAALIARMFSSDFTGRLVFRRGTTELVIHVESGRPVFASSNLARDRMGELLLREGKITAEQLSRCRDLVRDTGRRMGEILVERGFLKRRELLPAVRRHVEDIIYSLFAWDTGEYRIVAGDGASGERIRLSRHPAAMVLEGVRRKLDRATLERLLGPPTAVVEAGDRDKLAAIIGVADLSAEERAAVAAFDGTADLAHVARATGADLLNVYQLAWGLHLLGLATMRRRAGDDDGDAPALVGESDLAIDRERVRARHALVLDADYFALLGVRRDASGFEIKRAYEAARRDFAADTFPAELRKELATELDDIAQVLDEAYRVLRDDVLRTKYVSHLRDFGEAAS